MIKIKNKNAINKMREGGRLLAGVIEHASQSIQPGVSTLELNDLIEQRMVAVGLKPVCKGYIGYQHASCISVNDEVVHGVPSGEKILKNGDLVKIDIVGAYKEYCVDMARCFFVGEGKPIAQRLVAVAQQALDKAIDEAKPGKRVSDLSACIQQEVEKAGFGVVRDFAGHGIGKDLHEEPEIPNFGTAGNGPLLQVGMTLAIEPMITERGYELVVESDGWTTRTRDGGLAAHIEDTIAITSKGAEILTRFHS